MQLTLTTLALLSASIASAAPAPIAHGPGLSSSPTFNLVYMSVGNAPKPVNCLNDIKLWYATATYPNITLTPTYSSAALFYKYASDGRIATGSSGIMFDSTGTTGAIPTRQPIELGMNNGTAGTDIMLNGSGVPTLWHENRDVLFQACMGEDGEVVLSYVKPSQRRLKECASVEMVAMCPGTKTLAMEGAQMGKPIDVPCVPQMAEWIAAGEVGNVVK
ncbi:hypothetical protein BU23DRAFT_72142 [Bimuria novae-zelandiae CBS 107.79]|uniref:Cell wall protein PhiA n=1 Tax=Bimuria novae-zelandiae CBS 107.79 TaxID=1447943 RepID=A0A6A5USS0_9PLEO|nr:hypothetical protein BU23DRAFT_72142 [Bimuria novae-zelandiae CBS 107.79]